MSVNQLSSENQQKYHIADDEIDLRELFKAIWQGKWIIIVTTFVFAVASVIYALSLPNVYKSEALLAPAGAQKGGGISSQLGGLAALAGVTLGNGAGVDNTTLALETLKSRNFIFKFIERNNILVELMAADNWNAANNELTINDTIYDTHSKEWVRPPLPMRASKPSLQEAYKQFMKFMSINYDITTGMITLSFEHYSPYLAQSWVQLLINDINEEIRHKELKEAEESILYLKEQIMKTDVSDIKVSIYSLIEEQMKTVMLANVRKEYAFKVVDKPLATELKNRPKRAVLVLAGVLLGIFIGTIIVMIKKTIKRYKEQS